MEDLTRVASNSGRSQKGATKRRAVNSMGEEGKGNASENVETVSSSSGSAASNAPNIENANGPENRYAYKRNRLQGMAVMALSNFHLLQG